MEGEARNKRGKSDDIEKKKKCQYEKTKQKQKTF